MSLTLGIDVGTSGVRSAVVDSGGSPVSGATAQHPPQSGTDIDATLWWDAVETCLRRQITDLLEQGHALREISAIAVDGTSGSMVLTDAALTPVSPALMYNSKGFDTEAARIESHAPASHITRGSNSALARAMRLLSLAQGEPKHLLHQADFIAAKLIGRGGNSDHNNALKTGYDPDTEAWPDWIGDVFPPDLLPVVHPVGARIGTIDSGMAADLGLEPDVAIVAGTTDSTAAFIACAPFEEGVAVTSLGSTLAVKAVSPRRIDDPDIGLYSHKVGKFWLVGGASNSGGAVLAHFFSGDDLARLSCRIDPDRPSGLNYYPLLKPGERFPINDPDFAGSLSPRPEDDAEFLAGLFDGIAAIEAICYREIEGRGGSYPRRIFSAGGGAKNPTYSAIRSRHLGVQVERSKADDAAIGAARIAGWAGD